MTARIDEGKSFRYTQMSDDGTFFASTNVFANLWHVSKKNPRGNYGNSAYGDLRGGTHNPKRAGIFWRSKSRGWVESTHRGFHAPV